MKVLIAGGSPRKTRGNTNALISEMREQLLKKGHTVDVLNVYDKESDIKHCLHCGVCDNRPCVHKDTLTPYLDKFNEYEALIIASPLYFFHLTSQVKKFLDRLYSVDMKNLKLGAILVSGSEFFDGGNDLVINSLKRSCDYVEAYWVGAVQKTTYDETSTLTEEDKKAISSLVHSLEGDETSHVVFIKD